jgi:predicted phosphodiesterase
MRIAAISDVHGNIEALEAVLTDIVNRGADSIVNLGDALSGPLFPAECATRLISLGLPTIQGNHERQLLTLSTKEMDPSDQYTESCVGPRHRTWIAGLPQSLWVFKDVVLVHGTPHSDVQYFLESVDENGLRPASISEIKHRAGGVSASLILCGHTHTQRSIALDDGRRIINPGSVGLPAYEDDLPFPHKVQSGSPHARYAIVEMQNNQCSVEMITVEYDWESMAGVAEKRGRQDWARALRTGLV